MQTKNKQWCEISLKSINNYFRIKNSFALPIKLWGAVMLYTNIVGLVQIRSFQIGFKKFSDY